VWQSNPGHPANNGLQGRVYLVRAAARFVGERTVRTFAAEEARVVIFHCRFVSFVNTD
jgi:hypothetical protein